MTAEIVRRRRSKLPGYLHHRPSGQARVRLNGVDHYLGPYGSEESRVEYAKLISQYANGQPVDPLAKSTLGDAGLTVNELCLAFFRHAKKHYVATDPTKTATDRKTKKATTELGCFKQVIRILRELHGFTPCKDYGPLALKASREAMVRKKWVRKSINRAVARIRHIFRWGVSEELIDEGVLIRLETVAALEEGRTVAADNPERDVVNDANIEAVKADVSPLVADLVELQRLLGCRSGELLCLTTGMIDRSQDVWIADLKAHKTRHKGKKRFLAIGPKAQLIMAKYLQAKPTERLFAMRTSSYRRAIARACERLRIDHWVPHQLRHTAGTKVREEFSLDHSQAVLGHSKSKQTEEYAKLSRKRAIEVALKIG